MSRRLARKGDDNRFLSRRQWLAMLGAGGVAGLAGCSQGDSGGDSTDTEAPEDTETETETEEGGIETDTDELPEVSGTYDTVTSAGFETLNPLYNTEAGAGTAIGRVLDQGYTFDDNNEYFPLLYDMSTDDGGQVWTFEVRDGLEFSDPYGQVTAESFVYQIQELHQTDWANTASSSSWTGVNVEQTGELEFQAELQTAQLLWPESFDPLEYPIPKGLVEPYVQEEDFEGLQQDEELLELQFTGNLGPYVLDEWERGSGTTYSRNEGYYIQNIDQGPDLFEGAPYFEGASISVVEEQASRLGALQTGEADAAAIPPSRFEEFNQDDNVNVLQIPQPFNEIISLNMRDNGWNAGPGNLFRYIEFRQAMAAAINKTQLIDGVFRGLAAPHFTWQPRWSRFYPGDDQITQWGVDDRYGSEVARGLVQDALEQSEYDYSYDGDALVNPDGDQVVLDIYHSAGQDTEKLMAEFAAQELNANIGIQVEVNAIDGTRFGQEYWTAEPQGGTDTINGEEVEWTAPNPNNPGPRSVTSNEPWDMSVVYGLNTFPLNPLTNQFFFDGPNGFYNPVGYYPEFNSQELFSQARNAESIEELQSVFAEIFAAIADEQPYIMLVFNDDLTGYNPDLVGPTENFFNGWDFPGWYFETE